MKTKKTPSLPGEIAFAPGRAFVRVSSWCAALLALAAFSAPAAELQFLHHHVPAAVTNAAVMGPSSRWERLNLTIGLPLRNPEGLTNLLQQIYDPSSANFRHYLTPEQFTEQFGPTQEDYDAVVKFARDNGLTVVAKHSNRLVVGVKAPIGVIEKAFHITLNEYQHPFENRTFRAPNTEPSLELATPVLSIGGLDNFQLAKPCLKPMPVNPNQNRPAGAQPQSGSASGGAYFGKDFRAAYLPGVTNTGVGQSVGLLEFSSGFYQSDINSYVAAAGVPSVPVNAVLLEGYGGGSGQGNDEVSLDIEMAICLAPGLTSIQVYEGETTDGILSAMVTSNTCKTLSASWTYPTDAESENLFLEMAAQGQTYFNASGDSDAYVGGPPSPDSDVNITVVGGTTLTTTGPAGSWTGETVWNSSPTQPLGTGGGISTTVAIPSWQQGINMVTNGGSTSFRNVPDVAMVADNIEVYYGNGAAGAFVGTSCSTPLWATFVALVNQAAVAEGQPTVGFINPAVYSFGKGSNGLPYTSLFHDVVAGNNFSSSSPTRYVGVPGYDLCTGWGSPIASNFIQTLAFPEPLHLIPGGGFASSGPVGGPFYPASQIYSLANTASGPLSWSLVNTSAWFIVSPTNGTIAGGGAATTITVSLTPATTNLPPGNYSATLWLTNLNDNVVQSRQLTLAVVTPPVITTQPASQGLLVGMTANFTVGIASNALVAYQWQYNGTNLSDAGSISGSATGSLIVSNVTSTNAGAYSVTLSNAAGVLASSNAYLTITPSAPVIAQQPTNVAVLPGAYAVFSVAAFGNTPFSYRWQFNGTNLNNSANFLGVTTSTLTVTNVSTTNAGAYSVVVTNPLGSVSSTGAVLSVIPVTAPGVNMATLASFPGGIMGAYPGSPLTQANDGNFYGTTIEGGTYGLGTEFRAGTNGGIFTVNSFAGGTNGQTPYAGLVLGKDGNLYGDTFGGGTYSNGTVFKVTTTGILTTLAKFNGNNGKEPVAALVQGTDGFLYGTCYQGGAYGYGSIIRSTTAGVMTNLLSFDENDGMYPSGVLVQGADGNFYGTTEDGGTYGYGTVFKVTPSGVLTSLYSFTGGNDGSDVIAGVIQGVDGNFYGVTYQGGSSGDGTVFSMTPAGALATLYSFTGDTNGMNPRGGLVQAADGNLYGTTVTGGSYGYGTVFRIAPTGSLTTIVQFEDYNGANPYAALVQGKDGNLYGTTEGGGVAGVGTVFRLNMSGALQITGQPANQTAYVGGSALFTVATAGGSPVFYQWQQDGVNLTNGGNVSGATAATLRITNVTSSQAALYSVIVSNASSSVTSSGAVLEVIASPAFITAQPVSQTCLVGTTATFSVTAAGDAPLSYQWQENGVNLTDGGNISGSATSILTITNVGLTNAGSYSVIVTNVINSASSSTAQLTVSPTTPAWVAATNQWFFTGGNDGAFPYSSLIQGRDGNLYGTAEGGGSSFQGTIFRLTLAGTESTVYTFPFNTSGAQPYARLMQATNGNFYGTTSAGGASGDGTFFRMSSNYIVTFLYSFADGVDGAEPVCGLTQGTDGNFYGAAFMGGASGFGSLFKVTPNGALTTLYSFSDGADGAYPAAALYLGKDGNFYGTTFEGGDYGDGTVFKVTTNGALTTLVTFNSANGALPEAGLIQGLDGNFYGTTFEGGVNNDGTVFCLTTNGVFTTLFSFGLTNGGGPVAELIQATDGNFYGTTSSGGAGGQGTAFKLTTNGVMTTLVSFDGYNGANPNAPVLQATDGNFYGTTALGGKGFSPSSVGGNGAIFRFTVPIFISNPFAAASAIADLPYTSTLSAQAVAPAGDPLTFALVSGPAWLNVASNGVLSGTPANANIGTNVFVVSLTDSNGVTASATMNLAVVPDAPPSFLSNPFSEPWANVDEPYSATIASNATAPNLAAGDVLTFAKVSGPAWLNVASNGVLSGTPERTNAATNIFVVSVTDLGGATVTATLSIYVDSPPSFISQNFATPAATVGLPYSGTIATNATDPDLSVGDSITFYKASGPGWLTVATNGALSGTPAAGDVGSNTFLVVVLDSDGLAGIGYLSLNVNADSAPAFASNPFTAPPAVAGQPYSASIATNATDPDFGDVLTFAKISGPGWLNVAGNGALSGTPFSINGGANNFVVSVADFDGLSTNAALVINVTAVPIVETITPTGSNLLLNWTGGVPPYQVQTTLNPAISNWQNLGSPTNATNFILSPSNTAAFYRIQGQ